MTFLNFSIIFVEMKFLDLSKPISPVIYDSFGELMVKFTVTALSSIRIPVSPLAVSISYSRLLDFTLR